ncbi:MAG: DUF3429 domain-containing protein [Hylemonella sp.]|uniref:DUF3429 domain-containing protein n=1 Tax=Hylemonella sp. TaxID=2066020 RepID=UPI0022BDC14E|nr:DUF3429 domain-containing protein [Hylemonella sp.]MCZ8252128.1 DUF3429 domain-containing protein [Hylemonella sp.]
MNQPPRVVALLGYGGLLPFALGALGLLLMPKGHALWQAMLLGYAAIILSFVGALHWGFAMSASAADAPGLYSWSVVPALLGWVALLLPGVLPLLGSDLRSGTVLAAALLIVAYAAHYLQDRRLTRRQALPAWYLPLRLRLSSGAVLALAVLIAQA